MLIKCLLDDVKTEPLYENDPVIVRQPSPCLITPAQTNLGSCIPGIPPAQTNLVPGEKAAPSTSSTLVPNMPLVHAPEKQKVRTIIYCPANMVTAKI